MEKPTKLLKLTWVAFVFREDPKILRIFLLQNIVERLPLSTHVVLTTTQLTFTCSEPTIETLEKGVNYVQA